MEDHWESELGLSPHRPDSNLSVKNDLEVPQDATFNFYNSEH